MIAFKKVHGDELLRLTLILSLLKTDPNEYLREEVQHLTAGLHISNGTDWDLENEAGTPFRPAYVHPKSVDNVLINHERFLFEELNSLGHYGIDRLIGNNERMSNVNSPVLHAYLLNSVATDSVVPPGLLEVVDGHDELNHDGVAEDSNVAQEVKIEDESSNESQDFSSDDVSIDPGEPLNAPFKLEEHQSEPVENIEENASSLPVPDNFFLHNSSFSNILSEITLGTFNVDEFLLSPDRDNMHIKTELEQQESLKNAKLVKVKKESTRDDIFSDNAIDDFIPYFTHLSNNRYEPENVGDDVFEQTASDLRDHAASFDSWNSFNNVLKNSDTTQQEDFEKYLLKNTKVEADTTTPIRMDEQPITFNRERASTSFTSFSSSLNSEQELLPKLEPSEDMEMKIESDEGHYTGDELLADMDLIDYLWKQDVDMGYSLDRSEPIAPEATKVDPEQVKYSQEKMKMDSMTELTEVEMVEAGLAKAHIDTKAEEDEMQATGAQAREVDAIFDESQTGPADDVWVGLSYTIDTETGEYVLRGDLPLDIGDVGQFNLIDEVLNLEELESPQEDDLAASKPSVVEERKEAAASSSAMLHGGVPRHAPHPHSHHPLAHYHHQSLMRQMSVERQWQDLASLLSIPPPPPPPDQYQPYPHHHHHPHNISSGHVAAGGYPPNYGPPAPPIDKHPEHYGAAGPIDGAYKLETHPQQHDPMYYQNGQPDMSGSGDGFLQSILNDEDLQLMDMAVNEGMYTMRALEGAGSHVPLPHPAPLAPHSHLPVAERDSASDSAVSSMGSERVASLSDGEWCDAGSDSAQDFHSSKFRPFEAGYRPERASGSSQPPQKKHHMFGKRCFQESGASGEAPAEPRPPVIKYEYPEPPQHHTYAHEPLLPHSGEFSGRYQPVAPQHSHLAAIQPALDLNPSHLVLPGPASGAARYAGGYAAPERVRHNHTYSAPLPAVDVRAPAPLRDKRVRRATDSSGGGCSAGEAGGSQHLTRDEKRAKALGIPVPVHDIINLPMDEFNERLSKHDLTEAQLSLIRDIRRRGKNKVAAQNCRKRKLDQITSLADEVRSVRDRKQRLQREHQALTAERQRVKDRFAALYRHVFQHLRDAEGRPVSSAQFSLQQAADGNVVLVPRMPPHNNDHQSVHRNDEDLDRNKTKHYEQQ